jgi:hypothetical protein
VLVFLNDVIKVLILYIYIRSFDVCQNIWISTGCKVSSCLSIYELSMKQGLFVLFCFVTLRCPKPW